MDSKELKYVHALNAVRRIGPGVLRSLKTYLGSMEAAWRADTQELATTGIPQKTIEAVCAARQSLNPDRLMEQLVRQNIWLITEEDPQYPPALKEIPSRPFALYGKGAISFPALERTIAVVGTRRPTAYGREATELIARGLADAGFAIVSGLAVGIDTRAHEAALSTKTKTIAVIGSGLDEPSLFPQENRGLLRRILEGGGTAVSEYPPGAPALPEHFPQRNRIISGLSRGVVVIEAREKSGALITARFALDQNREVFAVPGSIFTPTAQGPHRLIQDGAIPVTSAQDILKEFGIDIVAQQRAYDASFDATTRTLLDLLQEPLGVDTLKTKTGFDTPTIMASLSMLELKGLVRTLGADRYQRVVS